MTPYEYGYQPQHSGGWHSSEDANRDSYTPRHAHGDESLAARISNIVSDPTYKSADLEYARAIIGSVRSADAA